MFSPICGKHLSITREPHNTDKEHNLETSGLFGRRNESDMPSSTKAVNLKTRPGEVVSSTSDDNGESTESTEGDIAAFKRVM